MERFRHGGNLRAATEQFGLEANQFIDFSANINPLGPPREVFSAITENLFAIKDYPEPGSAKLKAILSQELKLIPEYIALGNGAVELIYLLMRVLQPGKVLIPAPTFSEYERAASSVGSEIDYLFLDSEQGFRLDTEKLLKILPTYDMVVICNPNNPTGIITPKDELLKILRVANDSGITVLIDEAFIDFLDNSEDVSLVSYLQEFVNLVILKSMTKFYAIPGLRLGALLASPEIITKIDQHKDPWNLNCFAQLCGIAALRADSFKQLSREFVKTERAFLYTQLSTITGLIPYPPSANYIFIRISHPGWDSHTLTGKLGEQGILVRDCSNYVGLSSDYIRVAVKSREANLSLLVTLRNLLTSG